tara:strand:+ start:313 stop:507 length:195 start_codon:yes stop_codon:yes gene_type:complete
MEKGTVKFFNNTKGFGFICDEASGKDYFVHSSGLSAPINDGELVEFELAKDPKGMRAVNVKPIE